MKTNIKIHTSYVTKKNLDIFRKNNILPLFIIRQIEDNDLIQNYSETLIHFKDLSPSNNIIKFKYYNYIKFEELFKKELSEIDLDTLIKRFEYLLQLSGARAIVLLGYGVDRDKCHRSIVADFLNESNKFENRITELIL